MSGILDDINDDKLEDAVFALLADVDVNIPNYDTEACRKIG